VSAWLRSGDENQLTPMQFAPAAHISIPQFKEEDRTVMVAMPIRWRDRSLPGIDLHKRSWTNNRVQRVILHPDVPVKSISPVHLL